MDSTTSLKKLPRRKQGPIALEPRVVFDADVPVAIDPIIDVASQDSSAQNSVAANPSNNTENVTHAEASNDTTIITSEAKNAEEKQTGTESAKERELIPGTLAPTNLTAKEIIFIDAIVADIEQYLSEHEDADVVLLDQHSDALTQIAAVLNGRTGIEAVHIISHGNTGELQAGNSVINLAALQSGFYNDAFASIKSALSEDADILIYGCNIAQGEAGQAFVQALAVATGADIAASTDDTGASTLGGDWDLESNTGAIDTDLLSADDWMHQLVRTIINPTGGTNTAGTDGLRIYVTNLGQIQVFYKNAWQFYNQNVTDTSTNLYNGFYMAVGSQVIGPDTGAEGMTKVAWRSSGAQTLTGTGTAADPWVVTTTMYYDANNNAAYNAANDTQVIIRTSYTNATAYFTQNVTVTPPATNTSTIKVYHALDTFLGGQDNGTATSTAVGGNTSAIGAVGTGAGAGMSIYLAEAQNSTQFNNTYSDVYNGAGLYGTGISGGGDLDNNFNTANNDIGIGAQWTLGAINTPTSFSYHIAFAGAVALDLDANNSTATGNNYAGVYFEGSAGTNVVDTDRAINNIIGDLNQVTVAVSNAQAGDVLNVTGLPAGITVTGNGTTSLTLSGAATEADYQTALSLVQFSTTSTNTTTRAINIQARNQINELSAVATANIGIDLRPTITLDTNNSSGGANDGGWQTTYTENGVAVRIADTDADINDRSQNDLLSLSMTVTGNSNGAAEIMNIGGVDIALHANNTQTVTVGGTAFAVNYVASTGVFSVNRSGGGIIPQADLDTLVQNITYRNTSENPTAGNRTVSITVSDARSTSTAAVSTINVVAVNDAAIISGTTTGSIVEASGNANAVAGTPSATGNLTSTDVDGVSNSFTAVSAATASVNGYGIYTMTAAGVWTYTVNNNNAAVQALNVGNTLTDTFTVTAADGTAQVVTITINGANDTAVIAGTATVNLTESNIAQSTSGSLSVTDVDNSNTFIAQSAVAGSNGYGVFSINVAGAWTYTMNSAQNAFAQGTTYTDSITVAAADGTTQVITVSILGTNDAPTVANPITAQSVSEDSALNFVIPVATFSEVDNGDSLTLSATLADGSALPAWLSFNAATRTISGTPANGDVGSLNIRVTATDSFGASVSNTFALTVNNTNDAPIANADSNTGLEDNVLSGNLLTNDTDVDLGDTQAVTTFTINGVAGIFNAGQTATIPGVGSFTLSNTGAYTFTPVANYNGTVPVITYTMQDSAGVTATATLGLTVTAVNDAPTVTNANASGTEDAPINGSVSGNDVDGNPLTYSLVGVAPAGVVFNADGTFSVTPLAADQALDTGESRVVTFQYIANDGVVNSAPATITVTINGVNDAPTVANTNVSGTEDAAISGSVFGNDVDVEALTYSLVGAAPAGVVFNADGTFSVTPLTADQALNVGDSRTVTFQYRANDGDVNSTPATVTVVINGVNDAPVANPDAQTVPINGSVSGNVLSNDSDVDNPMLSVQGFTIAGQPGLFVLGTPYTIPGVGEFTINANGGYTFTPVPNFNGTIPAISFVVTDGSATDTGALSLTMASNTPPVAVDDSQAVTEDTPVSGNLLSNDTDPNGNALTVSAATIDTNGDGNADALALGTLTTITNAANVTIGTITVNTNGSYTFNPASNYNGPVPTLTYTVNDGLGGTDTGSLTLGPVTAVNDAPTVTNANASGTEDAPINGSVSGNDVDGNPLTYSLVGVAPAGVVFNADGTFSVTPLAADQALDTGESRVVTFQYIANDGSVNSAPATTTVTINGVNDAPVAIDNNYSTSEDSASIALNPLVGDSDPDGTTPNLQSINGVTVTNGTAQSIAVIGGTINISATGSINFTPAANFNGTITVPYVITDGQLSATANQYIQVIAVNDAPVANMDSQTGIEDNGAITGNVLSNDSDVDLDALTVTQFSVSGVSGVFAAGQTVNMPSVGNLVLNVNGSYTFNPNANFTGAAPLVSYTVTDGFTSNTSSLSLTVSAVNDAPIANDVSVTTPEDVNISISLSATDLDGTVTSYTITSLPQASAGQLQLFNGTPVVAGQALTPVQVSSLVFVPANNFNGIINIPFTATDNQGATSSPANIVIDVGFNNDAPVANPSTLAANEDNDITGITLTGSDVDGTISGVTITSLPSPTMGVLYLADGTTAVVAGTVLTPAEVSNMVFKPAANFNGSVTIPFTVTDNLGAISSAAHLRLNLLAVNDTPVAILNSSNTLEDTAITISLTANDVDNNLQSIRITALPNASEGTLYLADRVTLVNVNDTLTLAAAANLWFEPALDYNGTTQISFVAVDQLNAVSASATYTIDVADVNDRPEIAARSVNTNEDQSINLNLTANTSDVDGVISTIHVTNLPSPTQGVLYLADGVTPVVANQSLTPTQAQQLVFVPTPQYNGTVTIQYQAIDDLGEVSATGNIVVNVLVVNDTPIASIDIQNTLEDEVSVGNVLSNDTDIENDSLSLTGFTIQGLAGTFSAGQAVTIPAVGTLIINTDGSYTFNPVAHFNGAVPTITYTISDGNTTATSTLNLSVTAVNDAPIANPITLTVNEDNNIGVSLQANDVDGTVATLRVTTLPLPATGVLQLSDGTAVVAGQALSPTQAANLVFVPAPNFNGLVNIPFTATDNIGAISAVANAQIQVNAVNDAPEAIANNVSAVENTVISNIQLLGNDVDGSIANISLTSLPNASQGTLTLANGSVVTAGQLLTPFEAANLRFLPSKDFVGTITLQFIATDNQGLNSAPQTFNITMTQKVDDDVLFEQLISQPTPLLAPISHSNNEGNPQTVTTPNLGISNGFNPAIFLSGVMTDQQTIAQTQIAGGDSDSLDAQLLAYLNKAGNGTFNQQDRTYVQQAVRQQPIDSDNAVHVQNAVRQSQAEAGMKQASPLNIAAQAITGLFTQFNQTSAQNSNAENGESSSIPQLQNSFPDNVENSRENGWQPAPHFNEMGDRDGQENPTTAEEKDLLPRTDPTELADKALENMASKLHDSSKSVPTAANSFNEQLKQARLKTKLVTTNSQITSV